MLHALTTLDTLFPVALAAAEAYDVATAAFLRLSRDLPEAEADEISGADAAADILHSLMDRIRHALDQAAAAVPRSWDEAVKAMNVAARALDYLGSDDPHAVRFSTAVSAAVALHAPDLKPARG